MSMPTTSSAGEFEFSEPQNQLIGSLAGKMGLVGFVLILFGLLQMINGISALALSRNPDRMLDAAEKAGMSAEQLALLKENIAGDFWSSPITVSAIAMAIAGLFLLLVGVWTRQAASGFGGIVQTRGKDVSRLMDALGSLNRAYGLIYYVMLVAAIISLASLAMSLWQHWGGGA
jgi:hypothetical protein